MWVYQRESCFFQMGLFLLLATTVVSLSATWTCLLTFRFFRILRLWLHHQLGGGFLHVFFYFHPYFGEDGSPMLTCAYFFFKLGWGTNHQPDKGKMVSPFYRKSWHAFCSLLPWIWLFVEAIKGDEILPKYGRIMIKPLNKDPYQTTKDILDVFKVNFIIHPPWFWWAKAPESWSVLCVLYVLRLYLTLIFGETNYRLGLGDDFKYFVCSPIFGNDSHVDDHIFFRWVEITNQ